MADLRQYVYKGGAWGIDYPPFEQLTSTGSDQKLEVGTVSASLAAYPSTVTAVFISVLEDYAVVRFGGSTMAPTATCGHILAPDTSYLWTPTTAACARFIRESSTNPILFATGMW